MVKDNPDMTPKEIAKIVDMSASGVSRALMRIGIFLKKRPKYTKKAMRQSKRSF